MDGCSPPAATPASARCSSSRSSTRWTPPLAALPAARLRTLVGPRAAALTSLWPDLADELGARREHGTPEIQVRRAFEAVTAVLRGLATGRPTLLLLDDLHQAGLATVELLHYLARHAAPARLLVLATLRTDEGADALDVAGRRRAAARPRARFRTRR